jgi:hypothetical protein
MRAAVARDGQVSDNPNQTPALTLCSQTPADRVGWSTGADAARHIGRRSRRLQVVVRSGFRPRHIVAKPQGFGCLATLRRFSPRDLRLQTGCCRSRLGGERRRPPEADPRPGVRWSAAPPRKPPYSLRMKDESSCAPTAGRYDCSLCRRPPALDPDETFTALTSPAQRRRSELC